MSSYVVYFNPPDFPGRFVVREWFIGRSGELLALTLIGTAPSLIEARALIPVGMVNFRRSADDIPAVLEVWM